MCRKTMPGIMMCTIFEWHRYNTFFFALNAPFKLNLNLHYNIITNLLLFITEDWNVATASLAHNLPTIPDSIHPNTIKIYMSATEDRFAEVAMFTKVQSI